MRHKRQKPMWWNAWVPLLLLAVLLVLVHQARLFAGGYQIAAFVMALLMYGFVIYWLWCTRRISRHEAVERAQQQERAHPGRQLRREPARSDHQIWDNAFIPWQNNGHSTHIQRRQ
jgi:hypothetical protein